MPEAMPLSFELGPPAVPELTGEASFGTFSFSLPDIGVGVFWSMLERRKNEN